MARYASGRRFHDLTYFEVEFFFFIVLEIIMKFRAPLQNFVGRHQFNVISIMITMPSKMCGLFLNCFCQFKLLGFVDQCVFQSVLFFQMFMIFP